jgi:hypothetical protein
MTTLACTVARLSPALYLRLLRWLCDLQQVWRGGPEYGRQ